MQAEKCLEGEIFEMTQNFLVSYLRQSYLLILKENFSLKSISTVSTRIDFVMVFGCSIASVIRIVKYLLFMNTGQLHFKGL